MTIRTATAADATALEELWRAFEREVPPPGHHEVDPETELAEIREIVDSGLAFVAEDGDGLVGFALARLTGARSGRLTDLYVAPEARRGGIAAALVNAVVEALAPQGVEHLELEVLASNAEARTVYHRWGFAEDQLVLVAPTSALRNGSHRVDTQSRSRRSTFRRTPSSTWSERYGTSLLASARGDERGRAAERVGGGLRPGGGRGPDRAPPVRT